MIRTVFMIGLFAILGLFVLKRAFGLFGAMFAILWVLVALAIKIAIVGCIVGCVVYFIVRIVSPDTARRWRERWSGSSI